MIDENRRLSKPGLVQFDLALEDMVQKEIPDFGSTIYCTFHNIFCLKILTTITPRNNLDSLISTVWTSTL